MQCSSVGVLSKVSQYVSRKADIDMPHWMCDAVDYTVMDGCLHKIARSKKYFPRKDSLQGRRWKF